MNSFVLAHWKLNIVSEAPVRTAPFVRVFPDMIKDYCIRRYDAGLDKIRLLTPYSKLVISNSPYLFVVNNE